MAFEVPEIVYAFGPQLKAFMAVGILLKYFRRKLLQFEWRQVYIRRCCLVLFVCCRWMSARRCVFCTSSKTWQIGLRTLVWKRTSYSYNISSFWKCLRLITVWEHIKKLSWKYVNTAEIIRKVTMTLLINSNKDFDWIKTPCLFYFRSVKFHYVKETRMMSTFSLVASQLLDADIWQQHSNRKE